MERKSYLTFLGWVLTAYLCVSMSSSLQAQEPLAYWSFEKENVINDEINQITSRFRSFLVKEEVAENPPNQDVRIPGGQLARTNRKYLNLTRENSDNLYIDCGLNTEGFTLAFFIRFPRTDFNPNFRLFAATDRSFYTHLRTNSLQFSTRVKDTNGEIWDHNFYIPLNGAGKGTYGYFLDNDWHQIIFKYDAKSGAKEVWIDGELPGGFSTVVDKRGDSICGDSKCKSQIVIGHQKGSSEAFIGDLDEVVLYDRFVDEDIHLQHYIQFWENTTLDFVFNRKKYGLEARRIKKLYKERKRNIESKIVEVDDSNSEYPSTIFSPEMEPLAQLKSYPSPRYARGHTMHRLYSWVNYQYLSGHFRTDIDNLTAVENSYAIQKEMALNWNYFIDLGNALLAIYPSRLESNESFLKRWVDLANEHPEIPVGLTTLWPQTIIQVGGDGNTRPYVSRLDLPDDYYLRDANDQFLARNGQINPDKKYISPAANGKLFKVDGANQKIYIESILAKLTRPLNFINENGEVYPYPIPSTVLEKDPYVVKEKNKLGYEDWDAYQAYKKTYFRKKYSDQFVSAVPKSHKVDFSWYGIDGGDTPSNRFYWNEAKKILTPIDGKYYSTTDFYPREPKLWETGAGPWHGWNWMEKTRKVEILSGDHVCSPYIGAGWEKDPTKNIRPSQWLGLLKNLSTIGAEFFLCGILQ